jgi:hypothetical protein
MGETNKSRELVPALQIYDTVEQCLTEYKLTLSYPLITVDIFSI